ncbi:Putative beta-galactosidase B [Fusarium odoratissimum]|uniref:Putative beta-galactosidase B n=1 Tax=Fusarium oxysporum f. sp. cubense (strain race 4) TaxID=2502994 RepID=N1RMH1_FUSC4|nr:Putative beta-galactosidase B [Fusarium odoratissimum]
MGKIASIEYFRVPPRWLFVKITDDTGAFGWGEASLEGHTNAVEGCLDAWSERYTGLDADDIENIWQLSWRGGFYRGGPVFMSALSGIDIALWDLKGATVRFYRTVVPLDVPKGYDASLSFTLHTEKKANLRAQLYVNGYQYGKTLPYISNETTFPVVPGILNYQGDNTIGLNIWAMDEAGGSMDVNWKVDGIYRSGFSPLFNAEYLQPGWEDRSQYA